MRGVGATPASPRAGSSTHGQTWMGSSRWLFGTFTLNRNHSPSSGYPLRDVLADQQKQERGDLFGIILLPALCDAAADYTASWETMIAGSVVCDTLGWEQHWFSLTQVTFFLEITKEILAIELNDSWGWRSAAVFGTFWGMSLAIHVRSGCSGRSGRSGRSGASGASGEWCYARDFAASLAAFVYASLPVAIIGKM